MAKAGFLVRTERATVKRLQRLGGAAVSQFENLVDGAIKLARGGQRTGKDAMRAINAAQKRTDEISRRLTALKRAMAKSGGGSKKRVKRRKATRRTAPKRTARRPQVRRQARRKRRI